MRSHHHHHHDYVEPGSRPNRDASPAEKRNSAKTTTGTGPIGGCTTTGRHAHAVSRQRDGTHPPMVAEHLGGRE